MSTTLTFFDASRASSRLGTELRTSDGSKCSMTSTASLSASLIASAVTTISWWSLPMCSATFRAAARSPLSGVPTANVGTVSPRACASRTAIAATSAESSPPERNTPTPTSLIIAMSL